MKNKVLQGIIFGGTMSLFVIMLYFAVDSDLNFALAIVLSLLSGLLCGIAFPLLLGYFTEKENERKRLNEKSTLSEADELSKFKKLLDDGVITQEEFDRKKRQILGIVR